MVLAAWRGRLVVLVVLLLRPAWRFELLAQGEQSIVEVLRWPAGNDSPRPRNIAHRLDPLRDRSSSLMGSTSKHQCKHAQEALMLIVVLAELGLRVQHDPEVPRNDVDIHPPMS